MGTAEQFLYAGDPALYHASTAVIAMLNRCLRGSYGYVNVIRHTTVCALGSLPVTEFGLLPAFR